MHESGDGFNYQMQWRRKLLGYIDKQLYTFVFIIASMKTLKAYMQMQNLMGTELWIMLQSGRGYSDGHNFNNGLTTLLCPELCSL